MLKTWPFLLEDFLGDRTLELCQKLLSRDREYIRREKEYDQALDRFTGSLGPEEFRLFLDYESAANAMAGREDELIYRQGLIDGVRLGYYIDRIRQGRI